MPDRQTFVIIGANLAGGRAAEALRQQGFDGRVVLVGAEPRRLRDEDIELKSLVSQAV